MKKKTLLETIRESQTASISPPSIIKNLEKLSTKELLDELRRVQDSVKKVKIELSEIQAIEIEVIRILYDRAGFLDKAS